MISLGDCLFYYEWNFNMDILLSIKPKYVKKIIRYDKKFEFRKAVPKKSFERVFIYSSAPEKKIVGMFTVNNIYVGTPASIWDKTKQKAGITYEDYNIYFSNKELAYALEIENLIIFKKPIIPSDVWASFKAPQSFCYIEGDLLL